MATVRGPRSEDGAPMRAPADAHDPATEAAVSDILDNVVDVVIRYGRDGAVVWASPSLQRVFGYDPADVVGTPFRLSLPHTRADVEDSVRAALTDHPDVVRSRIRAVRADGAGRWVDVLTRPVWDDAGKVDFSVAVFRDVTEQVRTEQALAASEQRYRLLAENASDVVIEVNVDGEVMWMSPSVRDVLGWEPCDLVGSSAWDLVHPDDVSVLGAGRDEFHAWALPNAATVRWARASGGHRWMSVRARQVPGDSGIATGAVLGLRDVEDEVQARQELAAAEALFDSVMQSSTVGVVTATPDGRFRTVNEAMCRMLGRDDAWFLAHKLPDVVHPDDVHSVLGERTKLLDGSVAESARVMRLVHADGSTVWVRRSGVAVPGRTGLPGLLLLQVENVTPAHEAQQELAYRAFHDPLTGLANRAWIVEMLNADLRATSRTQEDVGVLFIDLDNFKVVNDSLGHSAGDEVLAAIAHRISTSLRSQDRVGRFGGDEFVVVVPDVNDPLDVEIVAERISAAVAQELIVEQHRFVPTVSIGIAVSTAESTSASLLRDTDSALFRAKSAGRARWQFFDELMHAQAVARVTIEAELRRAIDEHEFVVYYQPIVSLAQMRIVGYEALVRWKHPVRGILPPAEFLPVAEESGLIVDIGHQVLDQVCTLLRSRPDLPGAVSVNTSPVQIAHPGWRPAFLATLDAHEVDPHRIAVEVTETAVLSVLDKTREDLTHLRDLGVGIHVDDFGTGYSSIALLRDLPVTGLKLDASFTWNLTADRTARVLASGLSGLAAGLGLMSIAEGIETPEQAAILVEQGWTHGQGYLFGRPGPEPASEIL